MSSVLVRGGRAYGVALADGEEIHARAVISNADPKITFLKLLDPKDLDAEFLGEIKKIHIEGCSLKINLALRRAAGFQGLPGRGRSDRSTRLQFTSALRWIM